MDCQHVFNVKGPDVICDKCSLVLADTEEFIRVRKKWLWHGGLTPDEHRLIDTWLNVKPVPIEANGLTKPENDLIAELAREYSISIARTERVYRSLGRPEVSG